MGEVLHFYFRLTPTLMYTTNPFCSLACSVAHSYLTLRDAMDCIACQSPLLKEFSLRQEYWRRL